MADDDDTSALLGVIGHASDILGVVLPAVSLAGDVIKWFSQAPGASDPIIAALQQVNDGLNAIQDEVLATWVTARQESLSLLAANSTAAMLTAYDFMQSGKDASSPEWADKIAIAQRDSLVAVQTFVGDLDGGYWMRPDSIKAISQDGDPTSYGSGWMQYIPDRPAKSSFGTVWDYRWGLPATIYAITARLVVMRLTGSSAADVLKELGQYDQFIINVCQRMYGGIKCFQPPGSEPEHVIRTDGIPIAVADIYGGYYIGGRFNTGLTANALGGRPYPPSGVLPDRLDMPTIIQNANVITGYWQDCVTATVGMPDLLRFSVQLDTALHPPSNSLNLLHNGEDGVFYRVAPNGDLFWYKYVGAGESDPSGNTGWDDNSGNPIGNGWNNFKFVLGAGNGVILSVDVNGALRWYRYVGNGESDETGSTGWDPNSGNQIGRGWNNFTQIIVQPAIGGNPIVIYGVLPNGNLTWYEYGGHGENDPAGSTGGTAWHPSSGNPIGNGWGNMKLFCGAQVIFGIPPSGELRWYSYKGFGDADVTGATGWDPNSGNVIATNWAGYRNTICGLSANDAGYYIFAVDRAGGLKWYYYTGNGTADLTSRTGWATNSGNSIGNGW